MALDVYLAFDGNCAEAMRFYQQTLGGSLRMMTHGESPAAAQAPPEAKDRIIHAHLDLDDRALMASDAMIGQPENGMHGFDLSLGYPTAAEGKRIFDQLADGGQVVIPYDKTFFAEGFGMLRDRFGTPWMVHGGMAPA